MFFDFCINYRAIIAQIACSGLFSLRGAAGRARLDQLQLCGSGNPVGAMEVSRCTSRWDVKRQGWCLSLSSPCLLRSPVHCAAHEEELKPADSQDVVYCKTNCKSDTKHSLLLGLTRV